jgi:hypothetical protein
MFDDGDGDDEHASTTSGLLTGNFDSLSSSISTEAPSVVVGVAMGRHASGGPSISDPLSDSPSPTSTEPIADGCYAEDPSGCPPDAPCPYCMDHCNEDDSILDGQSNADDDDDAFFLHVCFFPFPFLLFSFCCCSCYLNSFYFFIFLFLYRCGKCRKAS